MGSGLGIRLGLLIAAIAAASLAPNTYYLFNLGMIAVTTLVGVGLNILVGLSGQVSIGHAGFLAIGAYVSSLLMLRLNWAFWPALGVATGVTALVGAALSAPTQRVKGPYLAMVTIAFGIIVEQVLIEWVPLTGGFGGLSGIPKPALPGLAPTLRHTVLIASVLALLAVIGFQYFKQSTWGQAFQAVRDDEVAAAALGVNPAKIRILAFGLSAALTGVAGGFFAAVIGFVSPDSFTFHRSILFLLVVILGGLGSAEGPLVGAVILVLLPELLSDFAEYQLLFFGSLLLLTLWLVPNGVMSFFSRYGRSLQPLYPLEAPPEMPAFIARHQTHDCLQVNRVSIQFGGVRAVDNVSLRAEPGTITAVIGPNGAGKTTLLNLISGFYQPQSGEVLLGDRPLSQLSSSEIASGGISRTFQATRLFNSLSVLENLRIAHTSRQLIWLGQAVKQRSPLQAKDFLELLAFVGYRGDLHTKAANLPFVDRRLVEIARALATEPQVLLLDEPAAGLSKGDKERLAQLLRRIASSGLKVILIEHDMDVVMKISDTVVVLDSGQLIAAGPPATVQQDPLVLEAYLGHEGAVARSAHPRQSQPLLQVNNLSAGYGELRVLHNISLSVNQAELVAVIGANGAGKTTLLKALVNLIPTQAGTVAFAGAALQQASHEMAHSGIVLVPEGRQVFTELTVQDNLRLGAFSRQDEGIAADIDRLLRRFPRLQQRQHQRVGLLSGGEQQMLAIARGLMAQPKLLLLDEPSLGLAPKLVDELYQILASLRDEGMTLLLVDQMAATALAIADRAYLLETGTIKRSGSAETMRQDPIVAQVYLGH
ncbi:branched-chain amino acid ABC transporter ATP-binding protein/permease [Almyronema epifaneia]|uniref:ATP-binding cassette domain-containing protein n=1 Tax=Almyronema epifaneia S1 TaxID=2991925 RepID=A0ABW6I9E3_9CYAN